MGDRMVSIITIAIGLFVIVLTFSLPPPAMKGTPGPAFFPCIAGTGLVCCGLYLWLKRKKILKNGSSAYPLQLKGRVFKIMVLAALSPPLLNFFGFLPTCFGTTFFFLKILQVSYFGAVIIGLVITMVIYLAFHYGLQVQFPRGIWN